MGKESRNRFIEFIKYNQHSAIVACIFIFGIILRLLFIDSREIAYDDAFSYFLSRNSISQIIDGTAADTMPPLYYFLLHFWMSISIDLWFLRLLGVILNLGSAVFLFLLSKELFNKNVATIALFLFLISPFQIYHSQELRMYSLLLFGQLGYYYSILKITIHSCKNQKIWIILSIIFGAIAMYAHNLGVLGLIPINFLFLYKRDKETIIKILSIQGMIYFLFLPWLFFLPQQIEKIQRAFWTQPPGISEILQSFMSLFAFLPMPIFEIGIVLIFLLQIFIIVFMWFFKTKNGNFGFLIYFFLLPPIILFVLSYLIQPLFIPRVFILSAAWFFVLFGKYYDSSKNSFRKINLLFFIIISAVSLINFYRFNSFPRSEYKKLSQYLENEIKPENLIIHDNKLSFFPTIFYKESDNQVYIEDIPGSPNDTLATPSQKALGFMAVPSIEEYLEQKNVTYVVFQQTLNEYENLGFENPNLKSLFKQFGENYSIQTIGDILLYNFEQ